MLDQAHHFTFAVWSCFNTLINSGTVPLSMQSASRSCFRQIVPPLSMDAAIAELADHHRNPRSGK